MSFYKVYGDRITAVFFDELDKFEEEVAWKNKKPVVAKSIRDIRMLYLAKDGVVWENCLNINWDTMYGTKHTARSMQFESWTPLTKYVDVSDYCILNSKENCEAIMEAVNPYGMQHFAAKYPVTFMENTDNIMKLAIAPQIEQLDKAGFALADHIMFDTQLCPADIEKFNRLCKPGKNLKEIFKTSKAVYEPLKNCTDMAMWDSLRKMYKAGVSKEAIRRIYDRGFRQKDIAHVTGILKKRYNGKPIFSFDSLNAYLDRLDMNEAIDLNEALEILDDYLIMCQQLGMKPRVDGDSLKREHDICARLVRQQRNEILGKQMEGACDFLQRFNYDENVFTIRGVQSYNDLLDEANQQHNCVAGYASRIAQGQSWIFFMRLKNAPGRSLITVEVDPVSKEIRQKYLAYNQAIRNSAQSDFLRRWAKYIKTVA